MTQATVGRKAFMAELEAQLLRKLSPTEKCRYLLRYPLLLWHFLFLRIRLKPEEIPPPSSKPNEKTLCESMAAEDEFQPFLEHESARLKRCHELERRVDKRIGREALLAFRDELELSAHHALWQAASAKECRESSWIRVAWQLLTRPHRVFYLLSV